MSFRFLKKLPSPEEIKQEYGLSATATRTKKERDKLVSDIISGASDKFLVIIGPCSADNEDSVCDYISRLSKVQEKVKDSLVLVPRIYTNKPRTTEIGRASCRERVYEAV